MSEVIRGTLPFLVILSILLGIIILRARRHAVACRRDLRAMIVMTMDDRYAFRCS